MQKSTLEVGEMVFVTPLFELRNPEFSWMADCTWYVVEANGDDYVISGERGGFPAFWMHRQSLISMPW